MFVCAHGNVADFCKKRDMIICDVWEGNLRDYKGHCRVLVTDSDMSEGEYAYLKGELFAKGIELISVKYKDTQLLSEYLVCATKERKARRGGRKLFDDRIVIDRILELRRAGMSLRAIQADEKVRHKNGKKLSISTISKIIEREDR